MFYIRTLAMTIGDDGYTPQKGRAIDADEYEYDNGFLEFWKYVDNRSRRLLVIAFNMNDVHNFWEAQ